MNYKIFN